MEIISYLNQNTNRTYNQVHKSTLSLDELLYRQRKNRHRAQQQLDFSDFRIKSIYLLKDISFGLWCLHRGQCYFLGFLVAMTFIFFYYSVISGL